MPVERTNRTGFDVVDGACFAYYDESFDDCQNCKIKEPCKKATESEQVSEIRKQVNNNPQKIKELTEQFS